MPFTSISNASYVKYLNYTLANNNSVLYNISNYTVLLDVKKEHNNTHKTFTVQYGYCSPRS